MSRRVDEKQTAVNPCIRDETVSHGGEFFAEVCGVLVLDLDISWGPSYFSIKQKRATSAYTIAGMKPDVTYVFHNRIPASFIVDLVAVPWRIDDVELEPDAIFDDRWSQCAKQRKNNRDGMTALTVRLRVDLCRLPWGDIRFSPTFTLHQVRRKEGVDECGFSKTRLACISA